MQVIIYTPHIVEPPVKKPYYKIFQKSNLERSYMSDRETSLMMIPPPSGGCSIESNSSALPLKHCYACAYMYNDGYGRCVAALIRATNVARFPN